MGQALTVNNLTKAFNGKQVLNDVTFSVPEQSIYAFLGNNGAGKSTTIRILMGLLQKDGGTINVLEHEIKPGQVHYKKHIGSIIDSPALYQELTGEENLAIQCYLKGIPKNDITRALKIVDMCDARKVKVSNYSLGMKQRLALASALLGKPKLLILDEPTNGLDPKGMVEIRNLIKSLPKITNATVFISSHLLDEVEKMASHVAILNKGHIAVESSLDCLKDQHGQLALTVNDPLAVLALLEPLGYSAQTLGEVVQVEKLTPEQCAQIHQAIINHGYKLFSAQFKHASLEQYFHQLVLS